MAIGIQDVLAQMHAAAAAAASGAPAARRPDSGQADEPGSFASALKASLDAVSDAQAGAASQAKAFELGAPDVSLNDVMIDMQKANIGFQMSLQVRNKLVSAYSEIMGMQA